MMEVYQSWWEKKREGLCDLDTWTMKVCGRSDDGEEKHRNGKEEGSSRVRGIAAG